tara:strand:+ start:1126 stop:1437 length:312 start_codon:yes stop_codon:yes gene_type:complete
MKKTILLILLLGLITVSSTSCSLNAEEQPAAELPAKPDPVKILEERIQTERELRIEAQIDASDEALLRERWQLAAIALCLLTLVGFLAGTTIGSRGKRHAAVA